MAKPDMTIAWAETGGISEPSDAKKAEGYLKEKVSYQIINWVANRADRYIQHNNVEGVSQWDAVTNYGIGSLAKDPTDRTVYRSLIANNLNDEPHSSPNNWQRAYTTIDVTIPDLKTLWGGVYFHIEDIGVLAGLNIGLSAGETVTYNGLVITQADLADVITSIAQDHKN